MTRKFSESATAWLRDYHGSIDATALLLAHEAGQRVSNGGRPVTRILSSFGSDLSYWCPICTSIACEVVGRDVSARLELDRMREGHKAWHREMATAAEVAL